MCHGEPPAQAASVPVPGWHRVDAGDAATATATKKRARPDYPGGPLKFGTMRSPRLEADVGSATTIAFATTTGSLAVRVMSGGCKARDAGFNNTIMWCMTVRKASRKTAGNWQQYQNTVDFIYTIHLI
ncbi:MAG: hypothetical protein H6852_19045 [Geminicoccaceae bacterium]|jgi:hypothetical protein|nr:hypothetical protein [Geminicoccaceae bacterium]MCB9969719.1 hypothetical protein [Geminicoccaceae bacterium]HRY24625.1 hypothetical protein [Geminicoccaceae bacterium]